MINKVLGNYVKNIPVAPTNLSLTWNLFNGSLIFPLLPISLAIVRKIWHFLTSVSRIYVLITIMRPWDDPLILSLFKFCLFRPSSDFRNSGFTSSDTWPLILLNEKEEKSRKGNTEERAKKKDWRLKRISCKFYQHFTCAFFERKCFAQHFSSYILAL